ncbi:MAG TPA: UDP-N-acetylmuramate--L-alanine ligase [Candidatus Omnitrophica bacterium]|nr:UDP-N-acetylmuramate--L-alanine ligase [Candidatus Omnitrophota bacterium]
MIKGKTVHFIGIGGIGMSGLAEVFHCYGYSVQGSDLRNSMSTDRLEKMGVNIKIGHRAENIDGADFIIYSSCIKDTNPEYMAAKLKNLSILKRMEALAMLMQDKKAIAISGAHGKTTTTSLLSLLLIKAGLDPTVFIGADVHFLKGNARYGQSDIMVTEADESDGSFVLLNPLYSVSTNIDREHMDYYGTMENVLSAYKQFISNTKDEGCAFICAEDEYLKNIARQSEKRILKYGVSDYADIKAENIKLMNLSGSEFDLRYKGAKLGRIKLSIPGVHNVVNSLAAIGVAMELGLNFNIIKDIILEFKGADRRFRITQLGSDILIIDDYAHHPTEIKATLKSMEDSGRRLVAVFQPHRFSRTKDLKDQFGKCFDMVDHLVVTDIYSADEKPIEGVSGRDVCDSAIKCGHKDAHFISKGDIIKHLIDVVKPGDAIFLLGAGDIGELPFKIAKTLEEINANVHDKI